MNKKMKEKRALEQAIRDFEKRTKTKNPLGLSEQFIRGLNKKVKKLKKMQIYLHIFFF